MGDLHVCVGARRRAGSSFPRPAYAVADGGAHLYLYVKIPKGFFPQQDTGRLNGNVVGEQHISYQALVEKAKWFEEQVRMDPDVETVGVTAGGNGGGWGGGSSAQIFVQLKEKHPSTPDQVITRIRNKTSGMPGATL